MAYFAVRYSYADDATALDRIRPQHRAFLAALTQGPLLASGPLPETAPPSALLILRADRADDVAEALDADPFWQADLITDRIIEEWNPLIGVFAD